MSISDSKSIVVTYIVNQKKTEEIGALLVFSSFILVINGKFRKFFRFH